MSNYSQRFPLEYLSLANNVIFSLEQYKREKADEEDKQALRDAFDFIKTALRGELMERYTLENKTVRTLLVSSGALMAFSSLKSQQKTTSNNFQKVLVSYGSFILSLTEEMDEQFMELVKKTNIETTTQDRAKIIEELKEFFRVLRDLILEQEAMPMEKVTMGTF